MTSRQAINALCLECGLCCNGALFRDVELQDGDDIPQLLRQRLDVKTSRRTTNPAHKLPQPCSALCENLRCRVYAQRPVRCREFECALLLKVKAGSLAADAALAKIHRARARLLAIEKLLGKLGEQRIDLPLKKRFRNIQLHLEKVGCDSDTAGTFAKLSESYHALGLQLAAEFHPRPAAPASPDKNIPSHTENSPIPR